MFASWLKKYKTKNNQWIKKKTPSHDKKKIIKQINFKKWIVINLYYISTYFI